MGDGQTEIGEYVGTGERQMLYMRSSPLIRVEIIALDATTAEVEVAC